MSLTQRWAEDRPILAEICAIYQLLCVEEVQGKKRLGGGIEIAVSFAAIRKALNKDALKTTHQGDTEKYNVALFTKFLATKYFEENVVAEGASKWQEFELEFPRNFDLVVRRLPSVEISSPVGRISVTHHAINRAVERQMTKRLSDYVPGDITTIPDVKWSSRGYSHQHCHSFTPRSCQPFAFESRQVVASTSCHSKFNKHASGC